MERNVLHILNSLAVGGAENLVLDLLSGNPEYKLVYMQDAPAERLAQFRETGAEVVRIPCGKGLRKTAFFIRGLRRYIRKNRILVVHCHNRVDAGWAWIASRGLGVQIVLTIHGFNQPPDYLFRRLFGHWFAERSGEAEPLSIPLPDRWMWRSFQVAFVSGQTRNYYLKRYRGLEDSVVVYNGIDSAKIAGARALSAEEWPAEVREALARPDGTSGEFCFRSGGKRPLLGMAGSFNSPARRQQLLICRALSALLRERQNLSRCTAPGLPFVFLFIGEPNSRGTERAAKEGPDNRNAGITDVPEDEYAACRRFCRENGLERDVFFLPARTDIPRVLQALDGYVYASECDTFGLSVVEAVLAGLPVICSDIPVFREIVRGGELALPVANTPTGFAAAVRGLSERLRDPGQREISGREQKELRIRASELYDITVCRKSYRSLYESGFQRSVRRRCPR